MPKPPARGKRLFKLASMTASVAGGYAKSKVKQALGGDAEEEERSFRKASGERIAATLGELKGAAMKVGQFASAAKELFPPEVTEALTKLQREAPPMEYEVIAEVIESELGAPPEVLFQSFDREPFAAASIGQVHRARTDDGREVVVKVQYPGVDHALDSDLQQVKLALKLGGLIKVDKRMVDATFAELRARMEEELDYCNEADNVRLFHRFHADHEGVAVPDVVGERSAKRVLTLTYEAGRPLTELGEPGVPQSLRDTIGTRLAEMLTRQLYELRTIHGDPNPGNFAFRDDGTLVIYDFGCVKSFDDEGLAKMNAILVAAFRRDYAGLDRALIDVGRMKPDKSIDPADYDRWLAALAEPIYEEGAYDYGGADLGARVKALVPWVMKRAHWWDPVPDMTILDRAVGGMYDNLRAAKARVPVRRVLLEHVEL
jgi:predicted unusual protein kinase regulating ubiquinone biosynthesis (AarF/ABC1/UbiB family)